MTIEVPNLARHTDGGLVLDLPFLGSVGRLVRLPARETPLYISERFATRTKVDFTIVLPEGAKVVSALDSVKVKHHGIVARTVTKKTANGIRVQREVDLPTGRVMTDEYPAFREKVMAADDALTAAIRISLP